MPVWRPEYNSQQLVLSKYRSQGSNSVIRLGDTEPYHWPLNLVYSIIVYTALCMMCE